MPKNLFIDPKSVRRTGEITFKPIPVNAYQKSLKEEKENFSNDELLKIFKDMMFIREFEVMLNKIKTTNEYNGIQYNHPGPAHLSIGQEASAVGMAFDLSVDDIIFGSHRSHGEILAKGLSAIYHLDENQLESIMKDYLGGKTLSVVEKNFKGNGKILPQIFSCMEPLLRYLRGKPDSIKDWADPCMLFFHPLEFTRIMLL